MIIQLSRLRRDVLIEALDQYVQNELDRIADAEIDTDNPQLSEAELMLDELNAERARLAEDA